MINNTKNTDKDTFLAQWLEGNLTDTAFKKLVSEEDFLAYKKLKKGIDVFAALEKPLDSSFKNIQQKIENKPKVRALNIKWIASIAAMLLFFFGFYQFLGSDGVLTSTSFGEHKTVALLDGSEVILNAKSAINYSKKNWKNKREVFLNGEAFFKVKKGKSFTVKTKNGDITVLGTAFTVQSINHFFEVVCYKGKVKVIVNKKTYFLNPTESFRIINNKTIEKLVHKEKEPTWIFGESTFRSVPLKFVITDFEKQYHTTIDASRIDNNVLFTGSFSHKNKEVALKTIFDALSIKYKEHNNKFILFK